MQRFGRGARDPSLQALAILIAEPQWFYEVQLAKKKKKEQRRQRDTENGGRQKRRRVHIPSRSPGLTLASALTIASDPPGPLQSSSGALPQNGVLVPEPLSDSDEESDDEEGDEDADGGGTAQPAAGGQASELGVSGGAVETIIGGEGSQSVSEDMIEELCMGEGEKKTKRKGNGRGRRSMQTDRALCFFTNAHILAGPQRCRRYHSNLYFSNDKARECCIHSYRYAAS